MLSERLSICCFKISFCFFRYFIAISSTFAVSTTNFGRNINSVESFTSCLLVCTWEKEEEGSIATIKKRSKLHNFFFLLII